MDRKRIAWITSGGIFGGYFNQGIPALMLLAERIAKVHELVVFTRNLNSALPKPRSFAVRQCPGSMRIALFPLLAASHIRTRFHLVHGLWGGSGGRYATLAGNFLGIPSVVSLLGGEAAAVPEIGYGSLLSQRQIRRLNDTCKRAAAVTVLTEFQRQKLDQASIDTHDFHKIPLGIDPATFPFTRLPWRPPWRLLHVANLNEVKDQATLIRAFSFISRDIDAHLTVVGPDFIDGQVKKLTHELGLSRQVRFTGPVAHTELYRYFNDAHILLHSSLYESQAVVALEAMASGLAICSTDVGIFADLNPDCCLTSPCGDAVSLANNVKSLVDDSGLADKLIRHGKSWADGHTADWTAEQYLQLYDTICA